MCKNYNIEVIKENKLSIRQNIILTYIMLILMLILISFSALQFRHIYKSAANKSIIRQYYKQHD